MTEYDAILTILLSWASHLSGYPLPPDPPEVQFEPHAFFVENVCGNHECSVVGWYNDNDIVYIDERHRDVEDGFATSLIVHEFTHYLQHKSGAFDSLSCEDSVAREKEAYHIQTLYAIEALASVQSIWRTPQICNYANAGMGDIEK